MSSASLIALHALKRGGSKPTSSKADDRADTRGSNWLGIPHVVLNSPAFEHLSLFARAILVEIMLHFNGFNNGTIAVGQRQIAARLHNSNYRKIGQAIAELMEHGLICIEAEGKWLTNHAREYRLTFVNTTTGEGKHVAATNDYLSWKPGAQTGVAAGSTARRKSVYASSTRASQSADPVATASATVGEEAVTTTVDNVTSLIGNHPPEPTALSVTGGEIGGLAAPYDATDYAWSRGVFPSQAAAQPHEDPLLTSDDHMADPQRSPEQGTSTSWPKGTPLGGKFMSMDDQGFPMPPQIGSAANAEHQDQANAMYAAAKAGDWETLSKLAQKPTTKLFALGGGVDNGVVGEPGAQIAWPIKQVDGKALSSQHKWNLQKAQYAQALIDAKSNATDLRAKVDAIAGPADLAAYKKIGRPPGSSSPAEALSCPTGGPWAPRTCSVAAQKTRSTVPR